MATIVFRLQSCDSRPQTGPVTITRRPTSPLLGAVLISGSDRTVTPDAQGMVTANLLPGWYYLMTGWNRPIEFTVPNDSATYTLDALAGPGAMLTPIGDVPRPSYAFRQGHLWLTDLTGGVSCSLQIGSAPGYPLQVVAGALDATQAPVARLLDGALQLRDPQGAWHTLWLGGSAVAPVLRVGDDGVVPTQRIRLSPTQLQLPNLDATHPADGTLTFHALLLVGTPSGLSLAFGPNLNNP